MVKWLFGIDGLKHKGFSSSMDTHLKKTMLQQAFKDGFKGGIVKSSFDEEWAYGADGTLQCTEGWTVRPFFLTLSLAHSYHALTLSLSHTISLPLARGSRRV